jgi:DNA-3-methyladenine glycosylase I
MTVIRCHWAENTDAQMQEYHDTEWGVPQHDDRALFELLTLEGAQAGLSWRTVLVRRDAYRAAQHGSLDRYLWSFVDHEPISNRWTDRGQVPATTKISDAMSKALKKAGFRFVGSTICYAFMQATGMVDDHLVTCFRHTQE